MSYVIEVPGDKPVVCKDWRAVEDYLYLLEHSDFKAYLYAVVTESEEA
jgi:hypothetical protein